MTNKNKNKIQTNLGGVRFGIHTMWNHDESVDKLLDDCGSEFTGNRWDPWLGCSMVSSNTYCESNDECVPFGGASDAYSVSLESEYGCDTTNYKSNPYSCEVGDLSGKYGELSYNSKKELIEIIVGSAFEVDGFDLGTMSIVFRCHDGSRAFCSPFEEYYAITDDTTNLDRSYQNTSVDNVVSKKAYFSDSAYVYLSYFGKYEIVVTSDDITVPGNCGDSIYYRVFDDRFVFLLVCFLFCFYLLFVISFMLLFVCIFIFGLICFFLR